MLLLGFLIKNVGAFFPHEKGKKITHRGKKNQPVITLFLGFGKGG